MRTNYDGDKLRRRGHSQDWNIEAGIIGLLIEWSLHQGVGHNPDNGAPWLRLSRVENPDAFPKRTFNAVIFPGETGANDRDRLTSVVVVHREITTSKNLQADG